jgi:hypothetical protein
MFAPRWRSLPLSINVVCFQKASPSTATRPLDALDQKHPLANVQQTPENDVPLNGGDVLSEFALVEKLRIKFKAIFGRFSLDRETHKRIR